MAVSVGINSYVALIEADTYFETRSNSSTWTNATVAQKNAALVTATQLLDNMHWTGTAITEKQELAFPRVAEYFDPKVGSIVYLDGTTIPNRIRNAQFELAFHIISNEDLLVETGGVKSLSVGPITLTTIESAPLVPYSIKSMIRPLLVNSGSNTVWRAN